MASEAQLTQVVDRIVRHFAPERVILFGSHARGDDDRNSDVDLFIEMSVDDITGRRATAVRQAIGSRGFPLDIVVFTPEEVRYWSQAEASLASRRFNPIKSNLRADQKMQVRPGCCRRCYLYRNTLRCCAFRNDVVCIATMSSADSH